MKIIAPLAVCSILLLSACTSIPQGQQSAQTSISTPTASPVHYQCKSGEMITAHYPSTESVTIQYKNSTYAMKNAVSGSGARYVGDDLEWWTKGSGAGAYGSLVQHNPDGTSGDSIEICEETHDETCKTEDYKTFVSGVKQCLVIRKFGSDKPDTLIVWLHGDVSSGGPANYHFSLAKRFAEKHRSKNILSVALVRPGYSDGSGHTSTGAPPNFERRDHYTKENVAEVAKAVQRLKGKFQPNKLILAGHSGGAATAALVLGMFPDLADGAVLVSCPCDLAAWRIGRSPWSASEDPMKWVSNFSPKIIVYALTGDRDDNTSPQLALNYVAALKNASASASFDLLKNENHRKAFESSKITDTLTKLIDDISE